MTDPSSPHDIARRTFAVARRGYEQQEVRGFLHEVSSRLEQMSRTETELRERAERAEARLSMAEKPDEAAMLEVLGEETTRVLTSAREAAGEIRTKAEEAAARVIADATAEATELRTQATSEAEATRAAAAQESETLLEQARTELTRRQAEAAELVEHILAEAEADAEGRRREVQAELAHARQEADALREAGRQEGRAMVAEAQAVRERVLRDLASRRKRARQQVEKLNAGRERLLEAYDVVRRTVDEATSELNTALVDARIAADAAARRIDDEPEPTLEQLDEEVANAGLVDLPIAEVEGPHDGGPPAEAEAPAGSAEPGDDEDGEGPGPFSGEVPAVVAAEPVPEPPPADSAIPAPRAGQDRRSRKRRKKGFPGLPAGELEVLQPPSAEERVTLLPDPAAEQVEVDEPPASEAPATGDDDVSEETTDPETAAEPVEPDEAEADASETVPSDTDEAAADEVEPETAAGPVEADEAEAPEADAGTAEVGAAPEPSPDEPAANTTDALFARLRGGGAEAEDADADHAADIGNPAETTPEAPSEPEADGEVTASAVPFTSRAEAVAPVEKDLARRLKRALADEQNEVLDLLRRVKPSGVDDVLPPVEEHAARWALAAAEPLAAAAAAGASWSGGAPSTVEDLADELARTLTTPLRERIERSFSASDGNLDEVTDRVRALYREWKGQRLAETTEHFVASSYARGVFDGIADGAMVRWVVDPAAGSCPDCGDNVLAGAIAKGEEFPTGTPWAPCHPGCHCLVLPADA